MVDMAGKNLKALYNNELYKVGWLDTIKIELPRPEGRGFLVHSPLF